jgi:hypothetical protein
MNRVEGKASNYHPESLVPTAVNIYKGYKEARSLAGRPLVDVAITTGFVALASGFMDETPRTQTISHLYILEDILERQNCFGDEINGNCENENAFWARPHYAEEYAGVMSSINKDMINTYGQEAAVKKMMTINESLENWFHVNSLIESSLAGKLDIEALSQQEFEILEPINELDGKERARVYRELVDGKWLDVLLVTMTDGDREKAEDIKRPLINGTLLLQLSEDYANIRRDSRVGKITLMMNASSYTRSKRVNEIVELIKLSDSYLDNLGLNGAGRVLVKSALVGKSLISRARTY